MLKIKESIIKHIPFMLPAIRTSVSGVKYQFSKNHVRKLLQEGKKIFIEIGAGNKKGENGWVTIDMTKNCDVFWDLRNGIPFPDESITQIYSSHFFEHLSFNDIQKTLDECKRVLVPGGTFSICVPNARLYVELYLNPDSISKQKFLSHTPANNGTTAIDFINYAAYMDGEHKYMFDEENLLHILESKQFKNVRLRAFDPNIDMEARDFESIYAEAEK
jgi:predicted SAM-dependent methyltransferase